MSTKTATTRKAPAQVTLPAAVQAYLDRLVHEEKRDYAQAYANACVAGTRKPADPGTAWAEKARISLARLGVGHASKAAPKAEAPKATPKAPKPRVEHAADANMAKDLMFALIANSKDVPRRSPMTCAIGAYNAIRHLRRDGRNADSVAEALYLGAEVAYGADTPAFERAAERIEALGLS